MVLYSSMKNDEMLTARESVKRWRISRGLSQTELARRAGMVPSQLCKIESGRNGLTSSTIPRLAQALDVSIAELLGEKNDASVGSMICEENTSLYKKEFNVASYNYLPILKFEGTSREEKIVYDCALEYEREVVGLEEKIGIKTQTILQLTYPYGEDERATELLARDVRFSLGLGRQPAIKARTIIENAGVLVSEVDLPATFQSASYFNFDRRTLSIVLNKNSTDERKRYRLIYEIGAAVLFASSSYKTIEDDGAAHRFLRNFAAAFLMPEEAVRSAVMGLGIRPKSWTMDALVFVKEYFGVSAEAFALRLEFLGLITPTIRGEMREALRKYYQENPDSMEPHPPQGQTRLDILREICANY